MGAVVVGSGFVFFVDLLDFRFSAVLAGVLAFSPLFTLSTLFTGGVLLLLLVLLLFVLSWLRLLLLFELLLFKSEP